MSKLLTDGTIANNSTPASTDRLVIFNPSTGKISYITKAQLQSALTGISNLIVNENGSGLNRILTNTSDGSDNEAILISGGGSNNVNRGAYITVTGNEYADPSVAAMGSGEDGNVEFYTAPGGSSTLRVDIKSNGAVNLVSGPLEIGGSDAIRLATGTLSSAQILTSNSSPIEIIASPGAGQFIAISQIMVSEDYNSAAYVISDELTIRYSGGTTIDNQLTTVATQTNDYASIASVTVSDLGINEAVQLFATVGNPTTGNSDIKYKIWYTIETI